MASNAQKTPLTYNLQKFGRKVTNDTQQVQGKTFPASVVSYTGGVLTCSFQVQGYGTLPQVTVGLAQSRYVRLPLQPDDQGILRPADAVLGGITGLGTGTAGTAQPANLGALVFEPTANVNWPPVVDANAVQVGGPNGVVLQPLDGSSQIIANKTGITLTFGDATITLASSGITLSVSGKTIVVNSSGVTIEGKEFLAHAHSGVTTGSGDTGAVV